MGFWDLFKKQPDAPAPSPSSAPGDAGRVVAPAPAPEELERLLRLGAPDGPTDDEALAAFDALRSTPDEARASSALLRAAADRRLSDPLLVALGSALVDRGEPEGATRVLASASSSAALLLLADLAERRGDVPAALSYVERVLLRDLDHPGARERHQRWRRSLGFDLGHEPVIAGATVVAREPDAPFELLREVGRGGAAVVYEAIDRALGRHVALKVYHHPERDQDQLTHEARVAVLLEGPGVVRVFDVDPANGWIALEWAPGGTLREHIKGRDRAPLLPIARWAAPLATALARVHAMGWVHHDIKPANVVLSRTSAPILTDFGTARRVGEPSPPGSLGYLSPERMSGRASDPRDDMYGFGRVLEDALAALGDDELTTRFGPLAAACVGPDEGRPADARALVTQLRGLIG